MPTVRFAKSSQFSAAETGPRLVTLLFDLAQIRATVGQGELHVENLRLFDDTQQRATREQIARQITDKIRASRDIETALKTAVAELSSALNAPKAIVNLQIDDQPDKVGDE